MFDLTVFCYKSQHDVCIRRVTLSECTCTVTAQSWHAERAPGAPPTSPVCLQPVPADYTHCRRHRYVIIGHLLMNLCCVVIIKYLQQSKNGYLSLLSVRLLVICTGKLHSLHMSLEVNVCLIFIIVKFSYSGPSEIRDCNSTLPQLEHSKVTIIQFRIQSFVCNCLKKNIHVFIANKCSYASRDFSFFLD